MASSQPRPENMLPIMIVLGIMFLGICIAMNLFSRARFKKRTNAFAVAGRSTPTNRRSYRGPGAGQRMDGSHRISHCPSPLSPNYALSPTKQQFSPATPYSSAAAAAVIAAAAAASQGNSREPSRSSSVRN